MRTASTSLLTHLSLLQATLEAQVTPVQSVLSEGAFLETDPVLVRLNKQRLDARKYHQRLVRDFGFDDAMAEAAGEQLENIQKQYMTRLAMLRTQRDESEVLIEAKRRMQERREELARKTALCHEQVEREKKLAAQEKKKRDNFWFYMLLFLVLTQFGKPFAPNAQLATPTMR